MNKQIIKTLTVEQKKTMNTRVMSAIVLVFYFVLIFILAILSDNVNNWSPINSLNGRRACAFLLLLITLPICFITTKEICNIFFKFKTIPYIIILICSILLIYMSTFVYFLHYYEFINIQITVFNINKISGLQLTNIFTLILFLNIFLTSFVTIILLKVYHKLNFKNWLILTLLIGLSCGYLIGMYFFIFVRGWTTLLFLLLIVIFMDSFAYFGGMLFGKHKMAPIISPKKTWEGFIIALCITLLLAFVLLIGFAFIDSKQTLSNIFGVQFKSENDFLPNNTIANKPLWWVSMFFIIIGLSVISVFGDLCFSLFKRKYKIKDYGNLIPGHGGLLDRIDSQTFVVSSYFVFSFFVALFAQTVVFF